jgi:HSP20 family protein
MEGMTALMVRDPFLAAPFRLMNELFRSSGNGGSVTGFTPLLDVRETDEDYLVLVDLPGVKSEDVSLEVHAQVLTIAGSRAPAGTGEPQLTERPYGSFVRSLTLPKGVDAETIVADYKEGVLELRIPKPSEVKPKKIAISSGAQKQIAQ